MDTDSRLEHLVRLFDGAHSLTWLSAILHKAALEHGFDRSIESTLRWGGLTKEEFDHIKPIFLDRLKNVDSETLKEAPYFFSVLCNWYWLGGKVDARECVRTHSSDDKDFVELLELMHSRLVHYPGGEFRDYLDDDKVKMFFSSVHGGFVLNWH